jgi:hypothetical protein
MDTGNSRRALLLAENPELPKLAFQVIRGSIATLAQRMETDKSVEGLLRHLRTATMIDVHTELPEGGAATVDAINRELRKN